MTTTLGQAFARNFLGHAPAWYKLTVLAFLLANPVLLIVAGPMVAGWCLLAEFIFTLAMALRCYPLQPGGLLAIEAVVIGLTTAESVYAEVTQAFPVILLLVFMVAGIYFLRDLLLLVFSKLILGVRSRSLLAVLFCAVAALLSAFLDALTVIAVAITVGTGLYEIYHKVASGKPHSAANHDASQDAAVGAAASPDARRPARLSARADDARRDRHGDRRRHDAGRRAAEPADRGASGVELRAVLREGGARVRPCGDRRPAHLLVRRDVALVRLRNAVARCSTHGAAGLLPAVVRPARPQRTDKSSSCRASSP